MKAMSAVPGVVYHGYIQQSLAPELGLHGIPSRSLIEFEGGGNMLSHNILGEMLAANEPGILNERSAGARRTGSEWGKRSRCKEQGSMIARRWGRGTVVDDGPTEEGKQVRLLSQADAIAWLRESERANLVEWPEVDTQDSTQRRDNSAAACVGVADVAQQPAVQSTTIGGTTCACSSSPTHGRRHSPTRARSRTRSPVKLYDHDNNPRVLRSLVDNTVETGLVGGILKAEEHQRIDELKLQLELASHHAIELEDKIFQSQTGAPHRELLGELQLELQRTQNILQPEGRQPKITAVTRTAGYELTNGTQTNRSTKNREKCVERNKVTECLHPSGTRSTPRSRHRNEQHNSSLKWARGGVTSTGKKSEINMLSSSFKCRRGKNSNNPTLSSIPVFKSPSLPSPLPTPTSSLRRYLSSLRPFSADSARAAWGLGEPEEQFDGSPWDAASSLHDTDASVNFHQRHLWPVLFVIGSTQRPMDRHPLAVCSLPLFDDELVFCLAKAIGESVEKVRTAIKILSQFDSSHFQAMMKNLCRTEDSASNDHSQNVDGRGEGVAAKRTLVGIPSEGQMGRNWVRDGSQISLEETTTSSKKVPYILRGRLDCVDEPVVISEAAASRVLTAGPLVGVFGDNTVKVILDVSRPWIVFDSGGTLDTELGFLTEKTKDLTKSMAKKVPVHHPNEKKSSEKAVVIRGEKETGSRISDRDACDYPSRTFGIVRSPPDGADNGKGGTLIVARERTMGQDEDEVNCSDPAITSPAHADGSSCTAIVTQSKSGEEGVLVGQLVSAAAVRFRVYSVAVGLCYEGRRPSVSYSSSMRSFELESSRNIFIGGRGGSCRDWRRGEFDGNRCRSMRSRPASANSDELGLPPLKLRKGDKRRFPRGLWRAGAGGSEESAAEPNVCLADGFGAERDENDFDWVRPRSTPRCLRPGFKGDVTSAMLRQELEACENNAARLSVSMVRKAEAWTKESQLSHSTATTAAAEAIQEATALELAGTRAQDELIEAAKYRMRNIVDFMYLRLIRRSWSTWIEQTRRCRSLESAERLTRLVGAAALAHGVLEPFLRRRKRFWLRRWAAAMRAERVLEVQAAAVELQRITRGFVGRGRARGVRKYHAAVAVQRIVHGCAGRARAARRERYLRECRAVKTIETKYREVVWHRNAQKLKKMRRRENAATRVKAVWRACVGGRRPAKRLKEERRMKISAIMVQRLWRGVIARVEADALLDAKVQREAATRIQAVARGRSARRSYYYAISRERAATRLSCFWRCASARAEKRRRHHRLRLALMVNSLVRGFLGRLGGHATREERRRKQQALLVGCVFAQKLFRGKQGQLKARRELQRKCAAVELQRIVRGHRVRRTSQLEEDKLRNQLVTWRVAVAIQRLWRGRTVRRNFGQRRKIKWVADDVQRRAAFTIQSAYRRFVAHRCRRLRRLSLAARNNALNIAGHESVSNIDNDQAKRRSLHRGGKRGAATMAITDDGNLSNSTSRKRDWDNVNSDESSEGASQEGGHNEENGDDLNRGHDGVRGHGDHGLDGEGIENPEVVYEDMGDVVLVEITSSHTEQTPVLPEAPEGVVLVAVPPRSVPESHGVVAVVVPSAAPPAFEATLEYYEAKRRYLAVQEAAHGASALQIQTIFRAFAGRCKAAITRAHNCELAQIQACRGRAAVIVQARARGRAALKVAKEKRALLEKVERRKRGVITLQCAVRCFMAKSQLKNLRAEEKARQDRVNRMAARIQAQARGVQTREVWSKFFHSRALLERERQRQGAQKIQCTWRSRLARTEGERRKSVRDEALLAELLEKHLMTLLQPALEAERRHAYAVRLQCWWRGILAMKSKRRRGRELRETPISEVKHEEENAACVIQCHWRATKARHFYNDNYASLFRERERKKYCTECQGEYATRKCHTCLDKFCENCWTRIHGKGVRRFHHWEPFAIFPYNAAFLQQSGSADRQQHQVNGNGHNTGEYYGYFPGWESQANDWGTTATAGGELTAYTSNTQQQGSMESPAQYDYSYYGTDLTHYINYDYNNARAAVGTPPIAGDHFLQQEDPQQQFEATQDPDKSWCTEQPIVSTANDAGKHGGEYGGATAYDKGWEAVEQPYSSDGNNPYYYPQQDGSYSDPTTSDQMLADGSITTESSTAEGGQEGYDYEGATIFDQPNQTGGTSDTAGWEWTAPESHNSDDHSTLGTGTNNGPPWSVNEYDQKVNGEWMEYWDESAQAGYSSGTRTAGGTRGVNGETDTSMTGTSSGPSWSVNEYDQRFNGDWVEYWDESAQAGYFYNIVTGEASWTEPATG